MTREGKNEATYIIKDTKGEHFKNNASLDGLVRVFSLGCRRHLLDVSLVFEGQFIICDNCIKHDLVSDMGQQNISPFLAQNKTNLLFLYLNLEFLNFHGEIFG